MPGCVLPLQELMYRGDAMVKILQIESVECDRELFEIAFRHIHPDAILNVVEDEVEAIEYLDGRGVFADRARHPVPDLAVLGMEVPRMTGELFLEWKANSVHAKLPVVVVAGTPDPDEITKAKLLGAVAVVYKPTKVDELFALVRDICGRNFDHLAKLERGLMQGYLVSA